MEKLLSAQQVADGLGWHVKTLYRKVRRNEVALNFVRVGTRGMAFRPTDVERYISTHEVTRTGAGKPKKRVKKPTVVIMSDSEAQAFFRGIEVDEDGVLLSNMEDNS
jgi:excisionase family DNA binding protein